MADKRIKRLIVACDGTWVNSDNGFVRDSWLPWKTGGELATASNVTRLCRALRTKSDHEDEIEQIVYYQGGLGSQNNWWSYLFGGYLGEGISENIREAYGFLCSNYEEGDEIILIGFSRGAFTARSIGGLISSVGLLTRHGLGAFYPIFKDWERQGDTNYQQYESSAWPLDHRPAFKDPAYLKKLVAGGLTRPNIPIKAIGVFDTVGSLGVPTVKIFGIPLYTKTTYDYAFVNTEVAPNVEHAYQALALDERRTPFSPTIWESPDPSKPSALNVLKQCWFPGVHTSVGGGYKDTSISDLTLAWMITQLSAHLTFDPEYVREQRNQNEQFYKSRKPPVPVKPWAMGLIQRLDGDPMNRLTGHSVRTPGNYHATDPKTNKPLEHRMRKTCEFMHPSVRYRINQKGAGLATTKADHAGKGLYQPKALEGWEFLTAEESKDITVKEWEDCEDWVNYGKWVLKKPNGESTYIVEEKIEENTAQMLLLRGWPGAEAKLKSEPDLIH